MRGTLCFIGPGGMSLSVEFNGDMHPEGCGDEAFAGLATCRTRGEFEAFVRAFNARHFVYPEPLFYEIGVPGSGSGSLARMLAERRLDFASRYFEDWFSDWVFLVNRSGRALEFVPRLGNGLAGDTRTMPTDMALRLNFGQVPHGVPWLIACPKGKEDAR